MKKSILPLAVAAAMVAPAIAMADATLYGRAHMSIDYFDVDSNTTNYKDFKGWAINNGSVYTGGGLTSQGVQGRSNRLGVKGSEDLGGGLKAVYQIEFGVRMADEAGNNNIVNNAETVSMRNSFLGLAGNFGTFLVGRHDTPLKLATGPLDLFADTVADYNGTVGFHDVRADTAIAYISPSFSGFQLAAAVVAPGRASATGTVDNDLDSLAEAYSISGVYKNGPFYAAAAYELLGSDHFDAGSTTNFAEDWTKWRIGLGLLNWNGFTLAGVYEQQSDVLGIDGEDRDLWQISAGYKFGNSTVKASYGQQTQERPLANQLKYDLDAWTIGFEHSLSKRTSAYVLYTSVDRDNNNRTNPDWQAFSLGMVHSF